MKVASTVPNGRERLVIISLDPTNIWCIAVKKITFQLADQEFDLLESYCEQTERGKTEVLWELIHGLKLSSQKQR
jgi:hypothetical protein